MDKKIFSTFSKDAEIVLYNGNTLDLLRSIPDNSIKLIVTSPPYNIGKEYEQRLHLNVYLEQQKEVITECHRILRNDGSICWQVGNFVDKGEIVPLDMVLFPIFQNLGMKLRNRIVWHFEHGLHCTNRFSGRYESIIWFTKGNDYYFDLDPVRVPQKYPGKKYFKGPKAGQYSANPLGKNPGDVWIIPNVKNNHIEKTIHPCQFPVELIERLVLSMTQTGDWVLDPFVGVGTSIIAAIHHGRKGAGAELLKEYVDVAKERIGAELAGELKTRPMNKPVFDPMYAGKALTTNPWKKQNSNSSELKIFEPGIKMKKGKRK